MSKHVLGRRMSAMALRAIPFSSLFYTPKPFAAALTRRRIQLWLLVMSIWTARQIPSENGQLVSRHFKFSSLQQRQVRSNLSLDAGAPNIASFGLMRSGLELNVTSHRYRDEGSLVLSFTKPVAWDGWYLITSETGSPDDDPVKFALHAYDGAHWIPVGSSSYVTIHTSTTFFHSWYGTTTRKDRGAREVFDLYRLKVGSLWLSISVGFSLAMLGVAQREDLGIYVILFYCCSWTLTHCIRALHYLAASQFVGLSIYMFLALMQFVNLICVRRELWVRLLVWCGSMMLAIGGMLAPFDFYGQLSSAAFFIASGLSWFALGTMTEVFRRWTDKTSLALITADREKYDVLWADMAQTMPADLELLDQAVLRLEHSFNINTLLQMRNCSGYKSQRQSPVWAESADAVQQQVLGWAGQMVVLLRQSGARRMVTQLNSLYSQSSFRSKVHGWAAATGGLLRSTKPAWKDNPDHHQDCSTSAPKMLPRLSPVRILGRDQQAALHDEQTWQLIPAERCSQDKVQWAPLKRAERAFEKVIRCYGDDCSLLLDVVRDVIVFDNLGALIACLEALGEDSEVDLVRIKNRYSLEYDSCETAGYRDVLVNLRLSTPETRASGTADHVCELQLVLRSFFEHRSIKSHKHYVAFRNAMAR